VTPDSHQNESSEPQTAAEQPIPASKPKEPMDQVAGVVSKSIDPAEELEGEEISAEFTHSHSDASAGDGGQLIETALPAHLDIPGTDTPSLAAENASPEPPAPTAGEINEAVLSDSRRHTRRSFVVATAAAAAGYGVYRWLDRLPGDEMQPAGYRKAFETNASLSRAVFNDRALTPTYPLAKSENLRVNGVYGLKMMLDPANYRLQLVGSAASRSHPRYSSDVTAWQYVYLDEKAAEDQGHDTKTPPPSERTSEKMPPEPMVAEERQKESASGRLPRGKEEAGESRSTLTAGTPGLLLTMEDVLRLPRHELVTQFKCIEGWSQIVHWAGIRMADFLEAYPPALVNGREPRYVYMETPDGDYYTGYDLHVCRHPQTLLVTEMMGAPLTQYHGAPLRLHMPTKYGYKQIKRIGLISYTDSRPDDYWTKLGYDWYAGL